jgi:hypothetical protein
MRNIMGDRVNKSRRAVEALHSVVGGRDILINARTSVVKTCRSLLTGVNYGKWIRLAASIDYKLH